MGLIFTYLLTYGGAIASLYRPFVGFLIYVCFAIVKPDAMWHWSVPAGNYSRIIAIALLAGWGLHGFGDGRLGRARGIVFCLFAYWFWSLLSALQADQPDVAFAGFVEPLSKVVLPFIVGITIIESLANLKQLAWVIALSQGYVAYEMNLSYYNGYNRMKDIGFAGMDNNSVAIAMVAGFGLAFFLGLNAPKWWQKGLALGAALLMAHSIMFAFSRGGMLALVITTVLAFFLLPKKPHHYLIFAIAVVIGVRLAGAEVLERFLTTFSSEDIRDFSAQGRLQMWQDCWDVMLKYPALGVGPRHWPLIAYLYGWPPLKEAHSLWLQVGAELGFVGLGFLVMFYALCMIKLWPLRKVLIGAEWLSDVPRMCIASLVGFAIAAQFVSLYNLELPFYVALLGCGGLKIASQPALERQLSAATCHSNDGP